MRRVGIAAAALAALGLAAAPVYAHVSNVYPAMMCEAISGGVPTETWGAIENQSNQVSSVTCPIIIPEDADVDAVYVDVLDVNHQTKPNGDEIVVTCRLRIVDTGLNGTLTHSQERVDSVVQDQWQTLNFDGIPVVLGHTQHASLRCELPAVDGAAASAIAHYEVDDWP
jgi:hypothetical protein